MMIRVAIVLLLALGCRTHAYYGPVCNSMNCPSGTFCDDGRCKPECSRMRCAPRESCRRGRCLAKFFCWHQACPEGYRCDRGGCLPTNSCVDVICAWGYECKKGRCSPTCDLIKCPAGWNCTNAGCHPTCKVLNCPRGYECRNGQCTKCKSPKCAQKKRVDDNHQVNEKKIIEKPVKRLLKQQKKLPRCTIPLCTHHGASYKCSRPSNGMNMNCGWWSKVDRLVCPKNCTSKCSNRRLCDNKGDRYCSWCELTAVSCKSKFMRRAHVCVK